MYRYWNHVTEPLLLAAGARTLVEIGAGQGAQALKLLQYCSRNGGTLTVIDPAPSLDTASWSAEWGAMLRFDLRPSLEALPDYASCDAVLVDGDHNWYTVIGELRAIAKARSRSGHVPLILMHDTGWPYARRDMYYAPERIPPDALQPYERKGAVPGRQELEAGGILDVHFNATKEGGPRNGVMAAVTEFQAETGGVFRLVELPGMYGYAVLAHKDLLAANPALAALLDAFSLPEFARTHVEMVDREQSRERAQRGTHDQRAIAYLRGEIARLEHAVAYLRPTLAATEESLRTLIARQKELEAMYAQALKAYTELRTETNRMQASKSWRWTAPLRRLLGER